MIFAVLHFRAECCKTARRDFKSPASAIPPPELCASKLYYEMDCCNTGVSEITCSKTGVLVAEPGLADYAHAHGLFQLAFPRAMPCHQVRNPSRIIPDEPHGPCR